MEFIVTEYVIGFLFDGKGHVALIKKNRPEWQNGRLNGIGGHIEIGETPETAMVREFKEEAGIEVEWRKFAIVRGSNYKLHLFTSENLVAEPVTKTDEIVGWYEINNLPVNIVQNLKWMIPMADYKIPIMADIIHESSVC
jgi:8-oxo-dGTP diphosphatase